MKNEGNANYKWMSGAKGDFIRKGEIGDWQAMFSEEQNKMLENITKKNWQGQGWNLILIQNRWKKGLNCATDTIFVRKTLVVLGLCLTQLHP